MKFNIEGIFNVRLTDFESYDDYIEFVEKDENWDNLRNLRVDNEDEAFAKHDYIYREWDEYWVIKGYLVARRTKDSDKVFVNPDLSRYLLENTLNYVNEYNKEKFIPNLSIDSILDRISEVGIENLTEAERKFLDENG